MPSTATEHAANAIWAIGLPRLPPFATEQQIPTAEELLAVPEAVESVVDRLDRIAVTSLDHHTTAEYKEARRKSGIAYGESGLSATEQETRAAIRKAKYV